MHNFTNVKLISFVLLGYVDLGDLIKTCPYCQATIWYQERTRKNRNDVNAKYNLCCNIGRIQLRRLKNPPILLQQLLCDRESCRSRNYQ